MTDFQAVLKALSNNDVAYVVVGGAAIGLHGSSYRTLDIDIVYARGRENGVKIVAALRPLKPRLRVAGEPDGVPFVFDAHTVLNGGNFTMTTVIGDVDILAQIDGLGGYDDVVKYVELISVDAAARPIPVLSLDGLILAKRAANGHLFSRRKSATPASTNINADLPRDRFCRSVDTQAVNARVLSRDCIT